MSANTLTLPEQTEIITKYLLGESYTNLSKEYNVSTETIKNVIDNRELRTDVEKRHVELQAARESRKIDDIKEQVFTYILTTLSEINEGQSELTPEKKIIFFDKVSKMLSDVDKISRLNRDQSTSNDTVVNKNIKIDVANIIKELKTPEEKKNFLRQQLLPTPND